MYVYMYVVYKTYACNIISLVTNQETELNILTYKSIRKKVKLKVSQLGTVRNVSPCSECRS